METALVEHHIAIFLRCSEPSMQPRCPLYITGGEAGLGTCPLGGGGPGGLPVWGVGVALATLVATGPGIAQSNMVAGTLSTPCAGDGTG